MSMEGGLRTSVDARGVATLTLCRPEVRNALDRELLHGLTAAFRRLAADDRARVIVLTGEGSSFCSGADRSMLIETLDYGEEENVRDALGWGALFRAIHECPKPSVAMVNGPAVGGGVGLTAACDIAVAADAAAFQVIEIRLGLVPSTMAPYLVSAIGARAAGRYFLTGERFGAREALRIGLVHEVVSKERLGAAVEEIADALRRGGPTALADAKRLIEFLRHAPLERETLEYSARKFAERRSTEEGREGIRAAFERRPPPWCEGPS